MTQKPIKATLDSSDDSVKTQKPILIQLDDIPMPTDADAGKVLGVDEDGKYALTEGGGGGGGGKLYRHRISLGGETGFTNYNLILIFDYPKETAFTFNELFTLVKGASHSASHVSAFRLFGICQVTVNNISYLIPNPLLVTHVMYNNRIYLIGQGITNIGDGTSAPTSRYCTVNDEMYFTAIGDRVVDIF